MATRPPSSSSSGRAAMKRRRSSRRQLRFGLLSSPLIGRWTPYVLAALTAFYVGNALYQVRLAANVHGVLTRGASPAEVRYMLGAPHAIDRATGDWVYEQGPARTVVAFGGSGGIDHVACHDPQRTEFGCPASMGFGVGAQEPEIWYRLGAPSRQSYRGETKTITYDDLGLTFELERMEVIGLSLGQRDGRFAYLGRAIRSLLP